MDSNVLMKCSVCMSRQLSAFRIWQSTWINMFIVICRVAECSTVLALYWKHIFGVRLSLQPMSGDVNHQHFQPKSTFILTTTPLLSIWTSQWTYHWGAGRIGIPIHTRFEAFCFISHTLHSPMRITPQTPIGKRSWIGRNQCFDPFWIPNNSNTTCLRDCCRCSGDSAVLRWEFEAIFDVVSGLVLRLMLCNLDRFVGDRGWK